MNYPTKRGAAGAIFFDRDGKILLLQPTYKDNCEIPGGIIEENESPKECCEREILEELGLEKNVGELLCLEYQRELDDSYMFVFDGGVLTDEEIKKIQLQESEIKSFVFSDIDDIKDKVLEKMFLRIQKCIKSTQDNKTNYFETIY